MKRNFKFYQKWEYEVMVAHPKSEFAMSNVAYYDGYDFDHINEKGLVVFNRRPWIIKAIRNLFRFK